MRDALLNGSIHVHAGKFFDGSSGQHFVLRDSKGLSLVVEYVGGEQQVYQDLNDGGKTGWGIMTNEPEFPWHVRALQHYEWKQTLARSATTIPGGYYPDDRFLRIHQSKSAMPKPATNQEAVLQV